MPTRYITLSAKALGLIMGSRVDTSGDNKKRREIITNYDHTLNQREQVTS